MMIAHAMLYLSAIGNCPDLNEVDCNDPQKQVGFDYKPCAWVAEQCIVAEECSQLVAETCTTLFSDDEDATAELCVVVEEICADLTECQQIEDEDVCNVSVIGVEVCTYLENECTAATKCSDLTAETCIYMQQNGLRCKYITSPAEGCEEVDICYEVQKFCEGAFYQGVECIRNDPTDQFCDIDASECGDVLDIEDSCDRYGFWGIQCKSTDGEFCVPLINNCEEIPADKCEHFVIEGAPCVLDKFEKGRCMTPTACEQVKAPDCDFYVVDDVICVASGTHCKVATACEDVEATEYCDNYTFDGLTCEAPSEGGDFCQTEKTTTGSVCDMVNYIIGSVAIVSMF